MEEICSSLGDKLFNKFVEKEKQEMGEIKACFLDR